MEKLCVVWCVSVIDLTLCLLAGFLFGMLACTCVLDFSVFFFLFFMGADRSVGVVDEIYNEVSYVEPWVAGKGLGTASSAFCLLFKLFQMKLSRKQIKVLLNHQDSPYIRALGFLYLRFGTNPRDLWQWMEEYINDEEKFVPRSNQTSRPITMGRYVRDLLRNSKYYDAMLPRIPITAMRQMEKELEPFAQEDKAKEDRRHVSRSPVRKKKDDRRYNRRDE